METTVYCVRTERSEGIKETRGTRSDLYPGTGTAEIVTGDRRQARGTERK